MKTWKIIAIAGGAYLGARYLYRLRKAEENVIVTVGVKKDKIALDGISLLIIYNIKNPTAAKMTMTPPLISIYAENSLLTASEMQSVEIPESCRDPNGNIIIRAFEETGNIIASTTIKWINLATTAPSFIKRLGSTDPKDKIDVRADIQAQIFTPLGQIPYREQKNFKL